MIKVIDIQNHISKRLKENYPNHLIYTEDNRENVKTPAFNVSVRPLLTTLGMKSKNKLVNVDITYFSKNGTRNENLMMSEQLEDIFYLILRVYKRKLYIKDLTIREIDTVLQLGFTLDYNLGVGRLVHIEGEIDEDGNVIKPGEDVDIGIKPGEDIDIDGDGKDSSGYGEGTIEYMKELKIKEGNDI